MSISSLPFAISPRPPASLLISTGLLLACLWSTASANEKDPVVEPIAREVAEQYCAMANAGYRRAATHAQNLLLEIGKFLQQPSPASQQLARRSWLEAHRMYSETEVFRFGNPNVDAWEGRVNAWPLDEGLIDYVNGNYVSPVGNPYSRKNIIRSCDRPIDESILEDYLTNPAQQLSASGRITDIEANVVLGYHAIEFLLWGQDLNDPENAAGQRPHTDFVVGGGGTHEPCGQRANYLLAATRILIKDLQVMVWDWSPEGRYYSQFVNLDENEKLRRILIGMGSMSHAELAGERMRVALIASDQEEEQNCFSDTTHHAIYHNVMGIEHVYNGGPWLGDPKSQFKPALQALVERMDPALNARLKSQLKATRKAARALFDTAEAGIPFDRMILPDHPEGRKLLETLIDALLQQTTTIETLLSRTDELAGL